MTFAKANKQFVASLKIVILFYVVQLDNNNNNNNNNNNYIHLTTNGSHHHVKNLDTKKSPPLKSPLPFTNVATKTNVYFRLFHFFHLELNSVAIKLDLH